MELGATYGLKVGEETGRLSPPQSVTAIRLKSSMVIGRCIPDYIVVIVVVVNCLKSNYSKQT